MLRSRRPLLALALVGLLAAGAVSCSDDDAASPSGTSTTGGTEADGTAVTTTTAAPDTTVSTVQSSESGPESGGPASSLPPGEADPDGDGCSTLSGALALQAILPRDGLSWPDERQRVVTDARLTAQLYERAAGQLPGNEGQYATTIGAWATFVADTTQDADSAAAARTTIDGYPGQGEVAAANTELERWRGVNCG